jgi:phosphatidylinositol alpha-mannosyltransferase
MGGVEFLGRVSDEERDALFKTADVYCSPATGGESFGIVLLEAMAAGTSIVCSDIHGYKGVVRRGREALLVPPHDPKALAGALGKVLSDDALRESMARSGLQRAEEFSWERVTAKVEDYYGFVIRRLAAQGQLPSGFHADVPASPRLALGLAAASARSAAPALVDEAAASLP